MKLRLLISLFLIAAVSTTAFAASRALLSDTATLAANTFSTGTVDLQVSNSSSTTGPNNSSFSDSQPGFSDSIFPGQSKAKFFWLRNNSSDMDMTIAAQTASLSGTIDPSKVSISFSPTDASGADMTPITTHTLTEWNNGASLSTTIAHTAKQRYKMTVSLSPDTTTAGTTTFDFVFTGTQTP